MTVHGSSIQPLHIIQCDGWIYQKPEYACANQIPECYCDQAIDRPFVRAYPWRCFADIIVMVCFGSNQHQGNNFKRTKCCAECEHRGRCSRKIEVMKRAENSTRKKNDR